MAVGSADGKFVHQHFGRATHFQVFELSGTVLRFVETRTASPACEREGHDDARLQATVDLVADMDIVLVAAVGPAAEAALAARGVRAFIVQDFITNAMRSLKRAIALSRIELGATRRAGDCTGA